MSKYTDETRPAWHRPLWDKVTRPRFSGARRGLPEPSVVVPHSGALNRAQRRSQGRYQGFEGKTLKGIQTAPMLIRRSGGSRWTKKERAKLERLAERVV
jgi:hypothetical protein